MKRDFLSAVFHDFEEAFADRIMEVQIAGYLVWQIVKYPLYVSLEKEMQGQGNTDKVDNDNRTKRRGAVNKLFNGAIELFRARRKALRQKGNAVLVITSANNKIYRDENGRFVNFVADNFISLLDERQYIYAEKTLDGDPKVPSLVQTDFYLDNLEPVLGLWIRIYRNSGEVDKVVDVFRQLTQPFFKQKGIKIDDAFVKQTLILFLAEYRTYSLLLKWFPARLLVTSERPGTGMLAAANRRNLLSIDMQHGIIDLHHPLYTYSKKLKAYRGKMILPTYIGVFGDFHKGIICRNGFWEPNEIVVLGGTRTDAVRKKYGHGSSNKNEQRNFVLIPTQWPFFNEIRQLLNLLLERKVEHPIVLKIHPLEPAANSAAYIAIAGSSGGKIKIAEQGADIYKLITESMVVVGFDSAVLLEATTLSKPCITVTTGKAPMGIHGMFHVDDLIEAIVTVPIEQIDQIEALLNNAANNKDFYNEWVTRAERIGLELYANDYAGNSRKFLSSVEATAWPYWPLNPTS